MEPSACFKRVLLLSLVPLVKAYTVFETTCSAPDPQSEFMFVSAPNTRGTLNILWTSLFTIFACTWTVQHLSIPKPCNGRNDRKRDNFRWKLERFGKSFYWMVITIMAPEFIMSKAVDDLTESRRLQKEMQEFAKEDKVKWTLTHSFYAGMGGFVIRIIPKERFFYRLSAKQVHGLRYTNQIRSLPDITAEELKDRSKSDVLGKAVAIGQILWTIVQVIARAVQKLPVSPLEVAVVAFAVCAVFTYGIYWEKPQRVLTPIDILDQMRYDDKKRVLKDILKERPSWEQAADFVYRKLLLDLEKELPAPVFGPRPEYSWREGYTINRRRQRDRVIVTGIAAAVFGAVHLIAWDFGFPTRIELIWWRYASVYLTASPPVMALIFLTYMVLRRRHMIVSNFYKNGWYILFASSLAPLFCLYIAARLFILVEMFRTLFFLPAGSYISTWSANIPHFG